MKKLLKSVAALSLSAMMLLSPGVLAEEDEEESNVVELTTVVQEYEGKQIVLKTAGLDILEQDGYKFKDMNKNGQLDPYEDWRLDTETRVTPFTFTAPPCTSSLASPPVSHRPANLSRASSLINSV